MRRKAAITTVAVGVALALLPGASPAVASASSATSSSSTEALGSGSLHSDYVRDGEYWLDQYGIRAAWAKTRGAGVTIAIIDTGVDGSVPDLAGAISGGTDFSGEGSANGQKPVGTSESEHGTMVASLAAGRGTAGNAGVIGSAPAARILTISIGFGAADQDSDQQVADAVIWATNHGAKVINMSLTRNTLAWPPSWDKAFLYAMQHDVVIVAAAGNRGSGTTEVGAPATMPGVLTVAGVDVNKQASVDASSQGITIGVSAPSEQLLGAVPGGGYVQWSGTSGATPIVAGVVALVRAAYPKLDAANVINRIVSTATPAGAKGVDPIYGYGLLNAAGAVSATVRPVTANPMGSLADWIKLNRRAVATSTPTPLPSVTKTPSPAVQASGPQNPVGMFYPSPTVLRNVGVPLGVILLFVVLAVALFAGAAVHFRSLRRRD